MSNTNLEPALRDRALAALLLTGPLALVGELLVSRTHHRPLGAATFASLALLGLVLVSALAFQGRALSGARSSWQALAWALGAASVLCALIRAVATGGA